MIAILDYETCHALAVAEALNAIGASALLENSVAGLEAAHKIVLPPCDSFARGVRSMRDRGFLGPLFRAADQGRYILGIGEGLHILFDVSYQDGQHTCLGLVPGKVAGFNLADHPAAAVTPPRHQGWTAVHWLANGPLTQGVEDGQAFYFDHAFHAEPLDENVIAARAHHGAEFTAAISLDRVFATQFLPHLSGDAGRRFLTNFANL